MTPLPQGVAAPLGSAEDEKEENGDVPDVLTCVYYFWW